MRNDMTLSEVLADPMIGLLNAADGVDPGDFAIFLRDIVRARQRLRVWSATGHITAVGTSVNWALDRQAVI